MPALDQPDCGYCRATGGNQFADRKARRRDDTGREVADGENDGDRRSRQAGFTGSNAALPPRELQIWRRKTLALVETRQQPWRMLLVYARLNAEFRYRQA